MPAFRGRVNSAQGTSLMPAPTTMLQSAQRPRKRSCENICKNI
jgi:hypothetical protein